MFQKIELGDQVRDTVSGFKGIAIGIVTWLHGCNRVIVAPKVGKDGKMIENQTFDEAQLEIIGKKNVTPATVKARKQGGEKWTPQMKETPSRF
jgi:hypothetical protein